MTARAGGGSGPGRVVAVIDVGSNSVLLLTVAVAADGRARAVDQALATTRLGSGLRAGGRLDPAARARTEEAVAAFVARARSARATEVWAFATAAAREAADGAALAEAVAARTGVVLEILSGVREACLAYAAAGPADGALLAVDVGGRTMELTLGTRDGILATVSLPVGALLLTETVLDVGPPATGEERLRAAIEAVLGGTDVPQRARAAGAAVVASGGSATALAALDLGLDAYDPERVHGHVLGGETLAALAARLAAMPAAVREALPGLDPARAAILPAGALVLARVASAAGAPAVRVSDHGVRHAYLRERLAALGVTADLSRLWT